MAEVLLGQRVSDPLPIDHLALSKCDVDRVWNPVLKIVGFKVNGIEHNKWLYLRVIPVFIRYLPDLKHKSEIFSLTSIFDSCARLI